MGYICRNNEPIIVGTQSFICVAVCTQVYTVDNCFLGPRRQIILICWWFDSRSLQSLYSAELLFFVMFASFVLGSFRSSAALQGEGDRDKEEEEL